MASGVVVYSGRRFSGSIRDLDAVEVPAGLARFAAQKNESGRTVLAEPDGERLVDLAVLSSDPLMIDLLYQFSGQQVRYTLSVKDQVAEVQL
jgi:hypothetical protein